MRRDGTLTEVNRYRQSGKVGLDENTVTQHIGRGRTAEDTSGNSRRIPKTPSIFSTPSLTPQRGDSVELGIHDGIVSVTDATLECRLPQHIPYRDAIMRAAIKHDLDPALLAAGGEQESGMEKARSTTEKHLSQ